MAEDPEEGTGAMGLKGASVGIEGNWAGELEGNGEGEAKSGGLPFEDDRLESRAFGLRFAKRACRSVADIFSDKPENSS